MSLSVDSVDIKKKIEDCKTLQEVEVIRLKYLGKKGYKWENNQWVPTQTQPLRLDEIQE